MVSFLPPDVLVIAAAHVERAELVKYTGTLPWHVERQGRMLRRFPSKKLAESYMGVINGVEGSAPAYYRLAVADALKRRHTDEEAWKYAAFSAASIGLYPVDVQADPDTGRPL